MNKAIKVEWCENWIKALFNKHFPRASGIETNLFWRLAEESGLYQRGAYGSPMTTALENLAKVKQINDSEGNYAYCVFELA